MDSECKIIRHMIRLYSVIESENKLIVMDPNSIEKDLVYTPANYLNGKTVTFFKAIHS